MNINRITVKNRIQFLKRPIINHKMLLQKLKSKMVNHRRSRLSKIYKKAKVKKLNKLMVIKKRNRLLSREKS